MSEPIVTFDEDAVRNERRLRIEGELMADSILDPSATCCLQMGRP